MPQNLLPYLISKVALCVYLADVLHLWERRGPQQLLPKSSESTSVQEHVHTQVHTPYMDRPFYGTKIVNE